MLTQWFPKCLVRPAGREAWDFLGKLYSEIELIIILKMSEIGSRMPFRSTALATTTSLRSIKSFVQTLHLMHGPQCTITNSSCSLLTFGNIVTSISSCSVCPPRLNN
jgi:hypothetical protein